MPGKLGLHVRRRLGREEDAEGQDWGPVGVNWTQLPAGGPWDSAVALLRGPWPALPCSVVSKQVVHPLTPASASSLAWVTNRSSVCPQKLLVRPRPPDLLPSGGALHLLGAGQAPGEQVCDLLALAQ